MKLTKTKLKQIIKESLEDEYKEKLLTIFKSGNHQQAIELSKQVDMEDFLVGANLYHVVLSGVNLDGVNLKGADLTEADLTEADLSDTILTEANLSDTILTRANLKNIKYDKSTIWPEGFTP